MRWQALRLRCRNLKSYSSPSLLTAAALVLKPQESSPEIDLEILRAIRDPIDHYFRDHSDINDYIEDKLADIEAVLAPGAGDDDDGEAPDNDGE